jgi:hypothetical protein
MVCDKYYYESYINEAPTCIHHGMLVYILVYKFAFFLRLLFSGSLSI